MSAPDEYKRPTSVAVERKRYDQTRARLDKANKAKVPPTKAEYDEQSAAAKDHMVSIGRVKAASDSEMRRTSKSKPGENQY
jgi:hypothetical protein